MICGSLLPIPPRLSNRDIPPPTTNLFASRTVFPAPPHRRTLFDSPCRTPIRLGWTQRPSRLSPRVPFTIGGEARPRSPSPPTYPPNRLLAFLLDSLSVERLGVSSYPLIYTDGGEGVFFARISVFLVDSVAACDTLSIYMRAWWNGRHARFRFWWRNPCGFESHRPHHGNAQPASVARSGSRGAGFFHAAETKIQSIWHRHGRNVRATSCT